MTRMLMTMDWFRYKIHAQNNTLQHNASNAPPLVSLTLHTLLKAQTKSTDCIYRSIGQ